MKCPECGGKLSTIDTIPYNDDVIYRRKRCKDCRYILRTIEYEIEKEGFNNEHYNKALQMKITNKGRK